MDEKGAPALAPARARTLAPTSASETPGSSRINGVGFFSYADNSCADISCMHFPAIWKRLIPFGDHPVPLIRSRGRSLDVHPGTGDEFAFSLKSGCGVAQWPGCLVFDARGVRNLWVADAPNFAARQVTRYSGDEGLPIASLRVTADGRTLVYVRGSEANESGRGRIRPAESGHESRKCGRSRWTPALPGCWARWAARRKSAKMCSSAPRPIRGVGRRTGNSGSLR